VAAIVAGVVLRFWSPSALWLDETISVNIARLPITRIPGALSHDGSPPLYYVLLHYWMAWFGRSDFAVRALSGVISVGTLPLFWLAGRRLGGRTVAWVTFSLALSSPFAISYATTTRMYSLMILLSLLGYVALSAAWEDPTPRRLLGLTAVTAALLYTHYWGIYLILVAAGWLVWRVHRTGRGRPVLRAMAAGGAVWLPWLPIFAYQTVHTGTPWTTSASPGDLLQVFGDWSGGGPWGGLLMYATFLLFVIGTFGRTAVTGALVTIEDSEGRIRQVRTGPAIVIELKPRPGMGPMVGIGVATLIVAVILGAVADAAFVARYTAVVLPLFLMVMSAGVAVLPGARFRAGCLAVLVVAGLVTAQTENGQDRTQAVQVAAVLCPDQLGPAVDRLLHVPGLQEITFPRATAPQRVNWVDYRQVIAQTNVSQFAQDALARSRGSSTLWLVWRDGYPGLGGDCGYLKNWLNFPGQNGVTLVHANGSVYYEFENLTRYAG
jgi:mannosyltransferase